ncbi:MAG TPA: hypothetical protein VF173_11265 [Thermoanaerobaculia bacterium]|nr:hypothetical protein [Thermoanaerobaculia bacterium]
MTQHEFDHRREELEARYRVALEVLEAGHRAQVAELEVLWHAEREPEPESATPAAKKPRGPRPKSVLDELRDALDQLPEEFRKEDALRVLGSSPHRSTLFRALRELVWEGWVAIISPAVQGQPILYRRVQPGSRSQEAR